MIKIKLPTSLRWNGREIPVEGAMERALKSEENNPAQEQEQITHVSFKIENPQDYIFLQGRTHGKYSYPNLMVCKYRLADCNEVQNAAKQLGINVVNSAKELNGRDYIGNIKWSQALSLNLMLGGKTLTPREFEDFLLLLKSGKAVDGTGKSVLKVELESILNEILESIKTEVNRYHGPKKDLLENIEKIRKGR